MTADTSGLREKALARYRAGARAGARDLQAELRSAAPRVTGELRNSIQVTARQTGSTTFKITAEAPVIQAATTNTGARPHVIRPRRPGGMLSFYWPKVGRRVAFRFVNHPGNRGTGWWDRVMDRRDAILGAAIRRS